GAQSACIAVASAGDGSAFRSLATGTSLDEIGLRFYANTAHLEEGTITLARGLSAADATCWELAYDASSRAVALRLNESQLLTAVLPAALAWACIGIHLRASEGSAALHVGGQASDELAGWLDALPTSRIQI